MRRGLCTGFVWCAVAWLIVINSARGVLAQTIDPNEGAVRIMKRAASAQRDGSHLPLLFALRQLRDPDLKPFFVQLAQSDDWQTQVHAVLGLAEIDPSKHIDAALVTTIKPEAQESVIATGLDLELLGREQFGSLLAVKDLHPMARLFLLAEQVALGEPADQQALSELTKSDDQHVGSLAACLAAQAGQSGAIESLGSRLAGLPTDARDDLTNWVLEAIRRYRLSACAGWVKSVLDENSLDRDKSYRAVFTLLTIDTEAGLKAWTRVLGEQPTYQHRVRMGLVLLASGAPVPGTLFDQLQASGGEELITRIIAVGKTISSGGDPSDALMQLLDLGHLKSTDWAMDYVKKMPNDQAARVYGHLIDRLATDDPAAIDWVSLAVQSTSKLFEIDPNAVLQRLSASKDDELQQQSILLGLFETTSTTAGEAAGKLRRIGSGRADSLAFLLMAKHVKALTAQDKEQLGKIASGGGRVSEVLQVQAAWIYLKQTNQLDTVMTAISAKP
jgi:hypothetical protein